MEEEKEKKEEELAKQRREAKVSLAGLKVAHDITEIGEGDTVLTLRVDVIPLLNLGRPSSGGEGTDRVNGRCSRKHGISARRSLQRGPQATRACEATYVNTSPMHDH